MRTKLLLPFALLLLPMFGMAQGVGINNPTPDASALLDLTSTGKGLLLPRMTTVQRNAIPAPAMSLMIYNTTSGRFEYFDGLAWVPLVGGGTLDQAYDFGGAGAGRTITADAGTVLVQGNDGFQVTGTHGAGATLGLAGPGTRMFFHPRKSAFRAGRTFGTAWDDANIGDYSAAFGYSSASGSHSLASGGSSASGAGSVALGFDADAGGYSSTAIGYFANATGGFANALGYIVTASGSESAAIGSYSTASGSRSVTLGSQATATGSNSKSFSYSGEAFSFGETVLGLGATTYTPSTNGATQFRATNATDRLLVVGNAIDANSNGNVDLAERSDALVILKNGNTGIGSSTPQDRLHVVGSIRMVDGNEAAGSVMVSDANGTASWTNAATIAGGTLDQAYDFGGSGAGRTIVADNGPVRISGNAGLMVTGGTLGTGPVVEVTGIGIRMFFNPNRAAFRAGAVGGGMWDVANIGQYSFATNMNTTASGIHSSAFGFNTFAIGAASFASGNGTQALGDRSTAIGQQNFARSFGELVLGIGATNYTPSATGATEFRVANASDRLLVVGNAIDANNNGTVELLERSDALVILKNGNTGLGQSAPAVRMQVNGAIATEPGTGTIVANGMLIANAFRSFMMIDSNGPPALRVIGLQNGLAAGQTLIIACTAAIPGNGITISDATNVAVNGTSRVLDFQDTITFIWNGTRWLETSFSQN
ncbi:MAG: hypothetical protein KDC00_07515 [Flavobacteriales bacterium]|nr:hypothetical protein [Flavobacteriales bacterium]